ncbi:MAG: Mu transposase C-terminal domain-containing protein [Sulfuricaulis sp.]
MSNQTEAARSTSGELQKGIAVAPGFQSPKPGDFYIWNKSVVRIVRLDSLESVSVIDVPTQESKVVLLAELRPVPDLIHEITEAEGTEPIVANDRIDPSGKRHKRVRRWVKYLTRGNSPIPNVLVKKVATHLGMGQTALRKVIARFRNTGQVILEYKRGRVRHKKYLDKIIDGYIEDAINEIATEHRECSPAAVQKLLEVKCTDGGYRVPSKQTIEQRIQARRPVELAQASGHADLIKGTRLIRGRSSGRRPLDVVQIDFTIADIIIVDDKYRRPIGRPLLGLAIDVATRCVTGAWLFLEPPNHFTSGWMVAHSILPKTGILRALGLEQFPNPCYGRMVKVFVDGGFRIKAFIDACRRANIEIAFRTPGECQQGGIIERLIGTVLNELHMLHGTTYADPLTRRRAKIDPSKLARYTLSEAMQYLYSQLYIYHHSKHGGLKQRYPIDGWQAAFTHNGTVLPPSLPMDPSTFFIPFLWHKPTTIHRDGIYLERHWYRSEELRDWVGARVTTYYHKNHPEICYPEIQKGRFLDIPREEDGDPCYSIWCEKYNRKYPIVEADHVRHLAARVEGRKYQGQLARHAADATLLAHLLPKPRSEPDHAYEVPMPRAYRVIHEPVTERLED